MRPSDVEQIEELAREAELLDRLVRRASRRAHFPDTEKYAARRGTTAGRLDLKLKEI